MFGVLQDKVLGRALIELEGGPALGLVEAHLVEEGELQELTLLVGGGDRAQRQPRWKPLRRSVG